jgi:hypothetical protein
LDRGAFPPLFGRKELHSKTKAAGKRRTPKRTFRARSNHRLIFMLCLQRSLFTRRASRKDRKACWRPTDRTFAREKLEGASA